MVKRRRFWLFLIICCLLTVHSFSITRKSSDASIHIYSRTLDQGIVISQNGNVGINTLSATEALTVSGNGLFSGVITANYFAGNGARLTSLPTVNTANLALTSNIAISMNAQGLMGAISVATGNAVMAITTAGNVGIGTTAPSTKLDVAGTVSASALQVNGDINTTSTNAFYFGDSATEGSWRIIRSGNNLVFQRFESSVWVDKSAITP